MREPADDERALPAASCVGECLVSLGAGWGEDLGSIGDGPPPDGFLLGVSPAAASLISNPPSVPRLASPRWPGSHQITAQSVSAGSY